MDNIYNKDLNLLKKKNHIFKSNKKYILYLIILALILPVVINEIKIFKLKMNYRQEETIKNTLNLNINDQILEENKKIAVLNEKLNSYLLFDRALDSNLEIINLKNILLYENVYFEDIHFGNITSLRGLSSSRENVFDYVEFLRSSIEFQSVNIKSIESLDDKYYFEIEILFGGDGSE